MFPMFDTLLSTVHTFTHKTTIDLKHTAYGYVQSRRTSLQRRTDEVHGPIDKPSYPALYTHCSGIFDHKLF